MMDLPPVTDPYQGLLRSKFKFSRFDGFEIADRDIRPRLKPHQRDIVRWAVRKGRVGIFASFGLGKTNMQLEILRAIGDREGGRQLMVIPLGVRGDIRRDADLLGIAIRFIRTTAEVDESGIYLTNYESVREGKIDLGLFNAASLDEAAVLRDYGSETYQEFLPLFADMKYRFVATATPSPNRYKELIHYAGFLGIMDTGAALTRFFQRNSEKAGDLTLYPHMEEEFHLWLHSWSVFLQKPSDLGYSDEGYELPAVKVFWHEVQVPNLVGKFEPNGQGQLVSDAALGLKEAADTKRETIAPRCAKAVEIWSSQPDEHFIFWHDLEAERAALKTAMPSIMEVYGSLDLEERERRVMDFSDGRIKDLATKPRISGAGCNFQRFCARSIFVGITYKFHDFIQAVHRIVRFMQDREVELHIIFAETEREIRKELERKWSEHNRLSERMAELLRRYGLSTEGFEADLGRRIGLPARAEAGERWRAVNNDCVAECREMQTNSVDMILTSIPFGNHYEYTDRYEDFGHNPDFAGFFGQMDHLTPNLLRILAPGRIAAIHVKDRIQFGNVTGYGAPTVEPFHSDCIAHYRRHGFLYCGMITVVTDVVRENNATYRLGYTEMLKDGTKMGVGSPEYVLLFRKLQTDRSKGYADTRVVKDPAEYSLARWQVDAHSFWRSSGNRLLTAAEFEGFGIDNIVKAFSSMSAERIYDFEAHVAIGEARGSNLPRTFMAIAPGSRDPEVWDDVVRMRTLNGQQDAAGREKHICLARGSRVLTREHGYVPIEAVKVGEHALTHMGRWRPVEVVACTGIRPVITVQAQGVPGLTITPDHSLWTRKSDWVRERDGAEYVAPEWIEAQSILGGYVNLKLPPVDAEIVPGDALTWWIVGRWLADGHFGARGDAHISCGHHETEDLQAKLGAWVETARDTGTAAQLRLRTRGTPLLDILGRCGAGAAGKRLPPEAFSLEDVRAAELLGGYLSGDGHYRENRQRWMASSVSRDLLLGIAVLVQRVHGSIASVYAGRPSRETKIQGRAVECRQDWMLSFDLPNQRRQKPFILNDGAWKKVRSLKDAGEAETWCLRVAEDASFTAEGCIVKNCPLQLDIVERLIARYSNKDDLIFDPFGGLMTVPYCAIKSGRRGAAVELSEKYFKDGIRYLRAAEAEALVPDLFSVLGSTA